MKGAITRLSASGAVLALLVSGAARAAGPQGAPAAHIELARTAPMTATVPLDPAIRSGQFDNGLRYFIRANARPRARAELRLVVNVGSVVEDADQRGLAHFVEHMAFNGTRRFPKQSIVAFLESVGMRFGPDINAYTSFDETVYMLRVPTDQPAVLARAFEVLEDWSSAVTFETDEVEKERGVVIEEWRLGRGASARMLDRQFPVLLKDSRYAERLPIGTRETLQSFSAARLEQFYRDWYRPDLMSVVAVGDFDVAAVETLVRAHFGARPKSATARPRPEVPVPDHPGTLFAVATDPEASGTSVAVYSKMAVRDPTSVGSYRQRLLENIFASMLSARFAEIAQKPDAPFLGASAGRGLFVRTKEASILSATVRPGEVARGLGALFIEAERVARFGFTQPELDRHRTNVLRAYEQALAERDSRESASLADEYVRHVTERETVPGIEFEVALAQRLLPALTLADVNALSREWAPEGNRVVLVSAPDKAGESVPTAADLAPLIARAAAKATTPYAETSTARPLVETPPTGGRVLERTTESRVGITEWRLSNGVRVVLKPTTNKADEVVMRAFSPGGTSLASDADFVSASTAAQVVRLGGLGTFSNLELGKRLAGTVANAQVLFSETSEDIVGAASVKDLETMLQLVYLSFTAPRADPQIFGVVVSQTKAALATQSAQPAFAFQEALMGALSQNHPRARPLTSALVDEMNLEKSLAFYRDRMADASDFTFVFVGSFDLAAIEPLVSRYLGGLPSVGRKETWRDSGVTPPAGVVSRRVEKGLEPQSQTSVVFTGPFSYTQPSRTAIRAMAQVFQARLREVLREDLGGTYSVTVNASYEKYPRQEYALAIAFGSAPERTDALFERVLAEAARFVGAGPTATELSDVRQAFIRDFETNLESNSYLATQMAARLENGEDVAGFFDLKASYETLSAEALHRAAKEFLNPGRYVRVSLFPEKR